MGHLAFIYDYIFIHTNIFLIVTICGLYWLQWKRWAKGGSELIQGEGSHHICFWVLYSAAANNIPNISYMFAIFAVFCMYGPRIVVRSIKPIKKNEEVCIAYTDLLQPKAVRSLDLWSEYRFSCSCIRCSASPEMFIDYILNADLRSLATTQSKHINTDYSEISNYIDQIIEEYMSDGNAEACCTKLEWLLLENLRSSSFQKSYRINDFKLHPLHYLSINSYIVLSSAFKISSANESNKSKAFDLGRGSVAYSLLLAGSTHYLFMSEPSLIASAATFWVNAGETILDFLTSLCRVSYILSEGKRERRSFLKYMLKNSTQPWQYLVRGLPYLEGIKSPIDFKWLGLRNVFDENGEGIRDLDCLHCECKIEATGCIEESRGLAKIALCCLSYGKYLAIMCWGKGNYLVSKVDRLILV